MARSSDEIRRDIVSDITFAAVIIALIVCAAVCVIVAMVTPHEDAVFRIQIKSTPAQNNDTQEDSREERGTDGSVPGSDSD